MNVDELLEKRARLKRKKPRFNRQDSHKIKRIDKSWRKPRGKDSKMGQGLRGYRRCVKSGWGSPGLVKGLHKSGLKMRLISSDKEVAYVDSKSEGIIIASKVGLRKKIKIVEEAIKKNVKILNLKDAQNFLDETKKKIKVEKEKKEKTKEDKEKKKKREKPKKRTIEDKVETEKDRKEREKKEKDKLLTKPGKK